MADENKQVQQRVRGLRTPRKWVARHRFEITFALVVAPPFAWLAARMVDPPAHAPYKIQVVESSKTDNETRIMFENLAKNWPRHLQSMGDVPVLLEATVLQDDKVATAIQKADELIRSPDTLMVIGHLPSDLTEASLPIYLKVRPPVPYISTATSDDNLLIGCQPAEVAVKGFVPLIQPSSRNLEEGDAAVRYAIQKGKRRFLLVKDERGQNDPYRNSLFDAWHGAITAAKATVVGSYTIGPPPTDQQFHGWRPDCVLYAGDAGAAETLMRSLSASQSLARSFAGSNTLLAILADSVIETRGSDANLLTLSAARLANNADGSPRTDLRFTYATDAADYNLHDNVYARDALAIAEQLIQDLSERGGDLRYRIRSLAHVETVGDARRNLIRVMAANAHLRTWYQCQSGPCAFTPFTGSEGMYYAKRLNGMFHVWQLRDGVVGEMLDVDGWHPPRQAFQLQ